MADDKTISKPLKWIKITTDIFDDEKILLLESLPDADSIIVIWFKLLCLAGKQNNSGVFLINDRIAVTDEMLATIFRRKKTIVQLALKTFEEFGMIEIVNNVITIPNWGKHQSVDKIDARNEYMKKYMANYREKQKVLTDCKLNSKVNVNTPDKIKEEDNIEVDIEEEKEKRETNRITAKTIEDQFPSASPKLLEAVKAFVDFRAKVKKPMTERALKMLATKLSNLAGDDEALKVAMLDQSIFKSWTDVYEVKGYVKPDGNTTTMFNSVPIRIDFQRYRDADGEFTTVFETVDGVKQCTCRYDNGNVKKFTYTDDSRPTWIQ